MTDLVRQETLEATSLFSVEKVCVLLLESSLDTLDSLALSLLFQYVSNDKGVFPPIC